ncbi:unnamed protein product [Arctogadus glacialis]
MSQKRCISDFFGPKKAKLHQNTSRSSDSLSAARCLPSTPEEESSCSQTLFLQDGAGNNGAIASPRPPVEPNIDCAGNNDGERVYVPRVLCSPGPMFPGSYVPLFV